MSSKKDLRSLVLIPSPSPSVKIQIMGGKVGLKCKSKTLLDVFNKLFTLESLLTKPSNVLPEKIKQKIQMFMTP
jgi:hypothetical protein